MVTTGLIDTHAHLCDRQFDNDRQDIITQSKEMGIRAIICVGETVEDAASAWETSGENRVTRWSAE